MLRFAGAVACALAAAMGTAVAQSKSQLAVLDDVSAAMVAAEKCPALKFNSSAAASLLGAARMNISDENGKLLLAGRLFSTRYLWDLDKDPHACEKAAQNRVLLDRR